MWFEVLKIESRENVEMFLATLGPDFIFSRDVHNQEIAELDVSENWYGVSNTSHA